MNEVEDHDYIEPSDLPGNSKKDKVKTVVPTVPRPPLKLERVVKGKVVKKKRSILDRFAQTFFGDDAKGVGRYVVFDVLIPAAKNTISEMVSSGIEMLLFGETRGSRTKRSGNKSYVSYQSYYGRGSDRDDSRSTRARARYKFDDVIIETRGEAEEVLSSLVDVIDDYDVVTVGEFYDLVGMPSNFVDNKYGWDNLSRAVIEGDVRNGYILVMPTPKVLD